MIQFYLLRNSDAPFPIPTENLFTIHYSLFTILYSLFSILYSLFSIHYSLFSIHSYFFTIHSYFLTKYAGVAELADALDLGSSGVICAGSSPVTRTIAQSLMYQGFGHFLLSKKKHSQQKTRCISYH